MHLLPELGYDAWTILFLTFALLVLVQLLYVLLVYGRLAFFRSREQTTKLPPLSVIIAARNEADNIYENLPFVMDQDYPEFEVIVVVNQSVDESKHILQAYQQQYPNLRYTIVEKSPHLRPGKKLSVTIGVKSARYEHMVFTDADCRPNSKNWLREIGSRFSDQKQIILGYGPYYKKKGFLNRIIRFDTAWIAVNYFSYALAGMPYMGVGRNMAYTKTIFNRVNGFKSHYALPSGDDDLFIQETARKRNYSIVISPESYAYSAPETTWSAWIRQKTRHFTTSGRYQVIKKGLLGIYPLTLLFMYIFVVILLFNDNFRWISLATFGVIIALKWWIQGRCFLKIKEKSFIPFLPLNDLMYAICSPILYYGSENKTPNKW